MTKNQVRTAVGVFFVFSHLTCLGMVFATIPLFSVSWEDAMQTAAVIAPIFAGYTTAILKYRIKRSAKVVDRSTEVTWDYALFVFLFPGVLTLAIFFLLLMSHLPNRQITIENGRIGMAAAETALGVYLAFFMEDLFHYSPRGQPPPGGG